MSSVTSVENPSRDARRKAPFSPATLGTLTSSFPTSPGRWRFYKTVVGLEEVYFRRPSWPDFSAMEIPTTMSPRRFHGPAGWRTEPVSIISASRLETEVDLSTAIARPRRGVQIPADGRSRYRHSVYCLDPDRQSDRDLRRRHQNWRTQRAGTIRRRRSMGPGR